MNLEEARKVLWLKNNPRPLGELLDEGFLTRDRLEWAAQSAYSSKLKDAAKALLGAELPGEEDERQNLPSISPEPPMEIPISVEQARATRWPLPPYKGQPMGMLVEAKQLSLKDLGYAAENAWDEQVRKAAITLSLVRLEQAIKEPAPSAGFIHIVSGGRSYSERRESFLILIEGLILGIFFTVIFMLGGNMIIDGLKPHPNARPITELVTTQFGLTALVITLVSSLLIGWLLMLIPDQLTKRLDKQIDEYRRGQDGEDRAVEIIIQTLDGQWSLFRNISLPGRNKGDLDVVLVGPPGVWVLEVKNFRGNYRNVGEAWAIRQGKKWKIASVNPSRQAFKNAVRLGNFLKADHLNVFVNGAVVWATEEGSVSVINPSVAVWSHTRLPDELGNIWQGEKLSREERQKINSKLSNLCDEQKKPR